MEQAVAPAAEEPPRSAVRGRIGRLTLRSVWLLALALLAAIILFPIRFDSLRILEAGCVAFLWAGGLGLSWKRPFVRFGFLGIAAALALLFLLPGRSDDTAAFRAAYVSALRRYEGVTYVWGGETRLGVDCSGLTRAAYVDACYERGLATLNPEMLRQGLSMWWHDRSAKAIGDGYRGESIPLFSADSIDRLDHSRLLPGDLAVTGGGVHVMAYLGQSEWIEADPNPMRVICVKAPTTRIAWFDMPATFVRWRQMSR